MALEQESIKSEDALQKEDKPKASSGAPMGHALLAGLQRSAGNRAVSKMIGQRTAKRATAAPVQRTLEESIQKAAGTGATVDWDDLAKKIVTTTNSPGSGSSSPSSSSSESGASTTSTASTAKAGAFGTIYKGGGANHELGKNELEYFKIQDQVDARTLVGQKPFDSPAAQKKAMQVEKAAENERKVAVGEEAAEDQKDRLEDEAEAEAKADKAKAAKKQARVDKHLDAPAKARAEKKKDDEAAATRDKGRQDKWNRMSKEDRDALAHAEPDVAKKLQAGQWSNDDRKKWEDTEAAKKSEAEQTKKDAEQDKKDADMDKALNAPKAAKDAKKAGEDKHAEREKALDDKHAAQQKNWQEMPDDEKKEFEKDYPELAKELREKDAAAKSKGDASGGKKEDEASKAESGEGA